MAELTEMEKRILRYMAYNGFTDKISISRRFRIAPATTSYVIRKLEENRVILGYRIRLNPAALGLEFPVLAMFEPRETVDSYSIINSVFELGPVYNSSIVTGKPDIISVMLFDSHVSFRRLGQRMVEDLGGRISTHDFIPILSIEKFHQIRIRRKKPVNLDPLDLEILGYLVQNPNITIGELSRAVGRNRNTVSRRVCRLWENQVIIKRSPIIAGDHLPQIGIGYCAFLFMDLSPGPRKKVVSRIARIPEVHELFTLASGYDAVAVIRAESVREVSSILRGLLECGLVRRTSTHFILDYKERSISRMLSI